MLSLAIKNARLVTPNGVIEGALGVEGERIAYIGGEDGVPAAERVIDGQGNYLIPGFINAHVHLSGWGTGTEEEALSYSFPLHTRAALFGGLTTVGVFLPTKPFEPMAPSAQLYKNVGGRSSYIDFYLNAIITSARHCDEIPALLRDHGVAGFKHFYNANKPRPPATVGPTGTPGVESDVLFRSLEQVAALGPPAIGMVHCEDQDLIWVLEDRLKAQGRNDLAAWAEARPAWIEALRMRMAYEIAKALKAPLYCVHIACAEGVEIMAEARREGYPYWGETCPHYLSHTADMAELGCWGRVNTAIKWAHDRDRLWEGIRDGFISNMGTDGAAFPRERKEEGGGQHNNIWTSRSGIAGGNRHYLPVMMSLGVNAGRISIEKMVEVCCTNNARVFGLYPQKGVLLEGSDADVVLVDPDVEQVVDEAFYHGSADWGIYHGWKLKGDARVTIVRGKVMVEDGELKADPGWGRYLPRTPA